MYLGYIDQIGTRCWSGDIVRSRSPSRLNQLEGAMSNSMYGPIYTLIGGGP
jgi:hypothetical protein